MIGAKYDPVKTCQFCNAICILDLAVEHYSVPYMLKLDSHPLSENGVVTLLFIEIVSHFSCCEIVQNV